MDKAARKMLERVDRDVTGGAGLVLETGTHTIAATYMEPQQEDEFEFSSGYYTLSFHKGEMPLFDATDYGTAEEIAEAMLGYGEPQDWEERGW